MSVYLAFSGCAAGGFRVRGSVFIRGGGRYLLRLADGRFCTYSVCCHLYYQSSYPTFQSRDPFFYIVSCGRTRSTSVIMGYVAARHRRLRVPR